ncbi:MAG TPA: DUF3011 domain-containing protein [Bryobacteraceae bacterium]
MVHYHRLNFPLWRLTVLTFAVLTLALLFPRGAQPQELLTQISCSSDGGRVFCAADTNGGVRLERQYRDSAACIQDETWGYTERGIWVDRGCAGEFALLGVRPLGFVSRITPGTVVTVRTNGLIDAQRLGGVYQAIVAEDVFDRDGRVAIPRGSLIQMIVRETANGEMVLRVDSIAVDGQPYGLAAGPAMLGQGPLAAPGEEILARGPRLYVPPDTLLTFQLD